MMSTEKFVPYTYLLYWEDGTKYYGVRYAKNCNPSDLLVTYFSSSKYVKQKIREVGLPKFRIHKTFPGDKKSAMIYENRVLRILRCPVRQDYLNKTYNKAIPSENNGSEKMRGKTYEEIYGYEKAKKLKLLRAESNKKRPSPKWTDASKKAQSLKNLGGNNPRAKKIRLTISESEYVFDTIKDASVFISENTKYALPGCVSAIRSKLYGKGVTKRLSHKDLYSYFDATFVL